MFRSISLVRMFLCLIAGISFYSCSSTGPSEGEVNISFKQNTGHYFISSQYPYMQTHIPTFLIIRNYAAFDSLYGWAGIDQDTSGIIHASDLQQNFLLDIVYYGNYSVQITVQQITLNSKVLTVNYTSTTTARDLSYYLKNHSLNLVSTCAFDSVRFIRDGIPIVNPFIDIR